jgi:hypothetical protein
MLAGGAWYLTDLNACLNGIDDGGEDATCQENQREPESNPQKKTCSI